jgi:hypothetical protein
VPPRTVRQASLDRLTHEVAGGLYILSPCPQAPYLAVTLDSHDAALLIPKVLIQRPPGEPSSPARFVVSRVVTSIDHIRVCASLRQ